MEKTRILLVVIIILLIAAVFLLGRGFRGEKAAKETLIIKGSDTELQLVSNLVEAFLEENPEADISVTGGGSGVGIAGLINGEIDLANSSRKIKDKELNQAKSRGLDVQEFILARDGLAIILHPENPVEQLTIDQISKIYKGEIINWKSVGGKDGKIVLYGRQSTSGTYVFFRDFIVKDDYSPEMLNMEGNQAIVDAIREDKNGIGYVGIGYAADENKQPREGLKIISVAENNESPALTPFDEGYPVSRPLFQYLPKIPPAGSLLSRFILFEASEKGQRVIRETGFFPVNSDDESANNLLLGKIR